MSREIILIGPVHEGSRRVKNKLTRPFGDTTLFDIFLNKLENVSKMDNPFSKIVIPICSSDKLLWNKANDTNLEIVERDEQSVESTNILPSSIHNYLERFDEDYVLNLNACFPFLKPETIVDVGNYFKDNIDSLKTLCMVKKRFNQFWNVITHQPINNREQVLATQSMEPIYEQINAMIIYGREHMLDTDKYWDYTPGNPYLYEVEDSIETLDIDYPLEFDICKGLYNGLF